MLVSCTRALDTPLFLTWAVLADLLRLVRRALAGAMLLERQAHAGYSPEILGFYKFLAQASMLHFSDLRFSAATPHGPRQPQEPEPLRHPLLRPAMSTALNRAVAGNQVLEARVNRQVFGDITKSVWCRRGLGRASFPRTSRKGRIRTAGRNAD